MEVNSVDITAEIDRQREKLLDLTKRNRLLNYKKHRTRTVQLIRKTPNDVFDRMVVNGKTMSVVPIPEDLADEDLFASSDNEAIDHLELSSQVPASGLLQAQYADANLYTTLDYEKMERGLQKIRLDAQSAIQETGVNILYLVLGFLEWYDSDDSDIPCLAPLLLIPAQLSRTFSNRFNRYEYVLTHSGEEVESNLCLDKLLEASFGMCLPEFEDGCSPEDYLSEVKKAVRSKQRWSVRRESVLGFFSFQKLRMYLDLDPKVWPEGYGFSENNLLNILIAGGERKPGSGLFSSDYDIDEIDQEDEVILVKDADSSQQSALQDIAAGDNLVIEGPPGTGKSQTITNAIAHAMFSGKSVLFVSEKLAALEVVHRSLERLGLSPFCLELHSNASKPQTVYKNLLERLNTKARRRNGAPMLRDIQESAKESLRTYLQSSSVTVGPRDEAAYEVFFHAADLAMSGITPLEAAIVPEEMSYADFRKRKSTLEELSQHIAEIGPPNEHTWSGFWCTQLNSAQVDRLREILGTLNSVVSGIHPVLESLQTVTNLTALEAITCVQGDHGITLENLKPDLNLVDLGMATKLTTPDRRITATQLEDQVRTYHAIKHELADVLQGDQTEAVPASKVVVRTMARHSGDRVQHLECMKLASTTNALTNSSHLVDDLVRVAQYLQERELGVVNTLTDYKRALTRYTIVVEARENYSSYIGRDTFSVGYGDKVNSLTKECSYLLDQARVLKTHRKSLLEGGVLLRHLRAVFEKLEAYSKELGALGMEEGETIEQLLDVVEKYTLIRHEVVSDPDVLMPEMFTARAVAHFLTFKKSFEEIGLMEEQLAEDFCIDDLPDVDEARDLRRTFRQYSESFARHFNGNYRAARRKILAFARSKSVLKNGITNRLDEIVTYLDGRTSINTDSKCKECFGALFQGYSTDVSEIDTLLRWAKRARSLGLGFSEVTELIQRWQEANIETTPRQIKDEFETLESEIDNTLLQTLIEYESDAIKQIPFSEIFAHIDELLLAIQEAESVSKDVETEAWVASRGFGSEDTTLGELLIRFKRHLDAVTEETNALSEGANLFQGLHTDFEKAQRFAEWIELCWANGIGYDEIELLLRNIDSSRDISPLETTADPLPKIENEILMSEASAFFSFDEALPEHLSLVSFAEDVKTAQSDSLALREAVRQLQLPDSMALSEACHLSSRLLSNIELGDSIEQSPQYRHLFGEDFHGLESKPDQIKETVAWLDKLHQFGLSVEVLDFMLCEDARGRVEGMISHFHTLSAICSEYATTCDLLTSMGKYDEAWLALGSDPDDPMQIDHLRRLIEHVDDAMPWANFCRTLARANRLELEEFTDEILQGSLSGEEAPDCYELTVYEAISRRLLEQLPALGEFSRHWHEKTRMEFQESDKNLIEQNRFRVISEVLSRYVPEGNASGRVRDYTELGLIRHEVNKQKSHRKVRDLVLNATHALQTLKPCFMMSPLSVAKYLPPGEIHFDIVIMDEASQVRPEDALGAMARASQMVIVGDPKQLPPTNFFDHFFQKEVSDEELTAFDETESILEVAMKSVPTVRRLKWHYRSRHESLVAFSNEQFYEGELIVFPSQEGFSAGLGIKYHHVEGGTFSGGCNPIEAKVVAEAIVEHAKRYPEESLGVGTFNAKHREAIEDALERVCTVDGVARKAIESLNLNAEPLFVKNLENLQGDERDVIFISYTYGPDPSTGRVSNRFGPINLETGWRRLNVLVTRARRRIEVFSSINPSDISSGPDRSRGLNAMRDYLEYAQNGTLVDRGSLTDREPDSPFEVSVGRVLSGMGLSIVPQVGVAGYFIDIGVLKPGSTEDFLIGIECDGRTYHSAKSVRDRDRLREEVIRERGWQLHRVWSTDWFLNRHAEEKRLQEAVLQALDAH